MLRRRLITMTIIVTLLFSVSGCGTILHPERKGQIAGQIDPRIALLNGIGLILFLVPGVIAFAVDFNNGAIYLPGGSSSAIDQNNEDSLIVIKSDQSIDKTYLEQLVKDRTGELVDIEEVTVEAQLITTKEPLRGMVRYM